MGPNAKKLVARKFSLLSIPEGGGLHSAIAVLTSPDRMASLMKEAKEWVAAAIELVKSAPDNPYGDNDEAIAGAILKQIGDRNPSRRA